MAPFGAKKPPLDNINSYKLTSPKHTLPAPELWTQLLAFHPLIGRSLTENGLS